MEDKICAAKVLTARGWEVAEPEIQERKLDIIKRSIKNKEIFIVNGEKFSPIEFYGRK